MKTKELNLYIVAENALVVNGLRHYLENRFGNNVHITSFYDCKSCLKCVRQDTDAVVVDYFMEGKKGSDVLKAVNAINPKTQGIFHSTSTEVATTVEALLRTAAAEPVPGKIVFKMDDQYNHHFVRV
jgi:DNA-binding NtrC family response regulator